MKKVSYFLSIVAVVGFIACTQKKDPKSIAEGPYETLIKATDHSPAYVLIDRPQVNLSDFAKDSDGVVTLFDGSSMKGWRGYNQDTVPARWTIDNDKLLFVKGNGNGEAQSKDGGDLIFAHKFKNFKLTFEWKMSKGGNSGVFILAQEVKGEPIYISSPEYQLLDNENHSDAHQGIDGNRQSASLYDMIPAKPQNAKPFGEWNTGAIEVYQGSVFYYQNDQKVVEYHLWTPQWTEMLQNSKFKQGSKEFPLAFGLLNNCGGDNHEGYIALQDHGCDIWFRNIKIKVTD
jgi:hypothetical protein